MACRSIRSRRKPSPKRTGSKAARPATSTNAANDRHLLVIDCSNRALYELYNVYYNPAQSSGYAGPGAVFNMTRNDRRPDTCGTILNDD